MSLQVGTLSALLELDARPFERGLDQVDKRGSRWGKAWGGVVGAAGTALKVGLGTAAVSTGALVATSLKKGWDRLTTIQDATAALRVSLGSAAKAGKLMGDILGVVKGTPFNLDQFAAAGAKLAGMGVAANKIPGYLRAIGEASATQGKRAGEFAGRLTDALGKMAASGQVGLEEVWSISETGVNALAILANGFGVTRDQMKDMISKGTVPAGKAMDILAKGIIDGSNGAAGATVALGGTMRELRKNMSGAAGGFSAALARIGATVLTPFAGLITSALAKGADLLDGLAARIQPLAEKGAELVTVFGEEGLAGVVARLRRWFDGLSGPIQAVVAGLAAGGAALAAVGVAATLTAIGGALFALLNPITLTIAGVALLAAGLYYAYQHFEGFRSVVDAVASWLVDTAWPAIQTFATYVADQFSHLAGWVRDHWDDIREAISHVVSVIRGIVEGGMKAVLYVWQAVGDDLLRYVRLVWGYIRSTVENAVNLVRGIIETVLALINGDWGKAWNGLQRIVGAIWKQLVNTVGTGFRVVRTALAAGLSLVGKLFWSAFGAVLSATGRFFARLGKSFVDGVKATGRWLAELPGVLVELATDALAAMGRAIQDGLAAAVEFFFALPGRILSALITLPLLLVAGGVALIAGLWNGITTAVPVLWGFFTGLPGKVAGFVAGAGKWLLDAGLAVIRGFWSGITTAVPIVWQFFSGLPGRIVSTVGDLGGRLLGAGRSLIQGLWNGAKDIGAKSISWAAGLPGRIVSGVGDLSSKLLDAGGDLIRGFARGLQNAWNAFASRFKIKVGEVSIAGHKIGGWSWSPLPQLHVFHQGGVVPGVAGREVLAVLQAGERVLRADDPLNRAISRQRPAPAAAGTLTPAGGAGGGGGIVISGPITFAQVPPARMAQLADDLAWHARTAGRV